MSTYKPKWAHLHEIDRRTKVGTPAWRRNNSPGAKKLSAWRRLHALTDHPDVHNRASERGRDPSSTMTTTQMLAEIRRLEGK